MKKLNYEKMIKDIDEIMREHEDFLFDIESKTLTKKKYTQKEAQTMENLITRIYMISHAYPNGCCGTKYLVETKKWKNKVEYLREAEKMYKILEKEGKYANFT